jgi:diguanylate cyclase (GGDEF)-like protein
MENGRLPPVSPAFKRTARRSMLTLAGFAVVVFGLAGGQVLRLQSRRAITEQANLVAAALVPGRDGDLSDSVARLQARSGRLIAVATLDPFDNLHTVYPDRPAHRNAVLLALAQAASPVTTLSPTTGEPVAVTGDIVPLNGSRSPFATKVLILLQTESYTGAWLAVTAAVALLVVGVGLASTRWLCEWFDRQVAGPLRHMAGAAAGVEAAAEYVAVLDAGRWRETAQIACGFEELIQTLADSDARTRRREHAVEVQMRRREIGFGRQLRQAKDQAATDPLTGLRNRAYLEEHLESLYHRQMARNAELAVVMMDVDNFKAYNDTHGHQVGDALLRFIGALLRGSIRPADVAVRYGGDEFLLLLPDAGVEQAAAIADRLVKLFGQFTGRLGREDAVSMSAGVASSRTAVCENGHALVNQADASLYAAKRGGKNAVSITPSSHAPATVGSLCETPFVL